MAKINDPKDALVDFGGANPFFNPAFEAGENTYRLVEVGKYFKGAFRKTPDDQWETGSIFTADNTEEGRKFLIEEKGCNDIFGIWACKAYSMEKGKAGILEIRQRSILSAIASLWRSPKWGNPDAYDITITRTGSGLGTEYAVVPSPKEPLPKEAVEAVNNLEFDLDDFYIANNGVWNLGAAGEAAASKVETPKEAGEIQEQEIPF